MQQHATESLSKALATCREVLEYVGGASAAQPEAAPLEFSRQEWHNLRMNCLLALSKVASCQLSNYIERHHHELVMLIVSYCILLYLIVSYCTNLSKTCQRFAKGGARGAIAGSRGALGPHSRGQLQGEV